MRPRLVEVLQDAGRGGSGGRFARRILNSRVSGQVALALLLLLSAGVMIRSCSRLLQVEPGFRTEYVMVAALSLPPQRVPGPGQPGAVLEPARGRRERASRRGGGRGGIRAFLTLMLMRPHTTTRT